MSVAAKAVDFLMSVKIEGGLLRGLPLKTDTRAGVIRPTSGKVRQALFNMLGDRVEGGAFLDLFAGSGAVAFEALSRGAQHVVAVERHVQAYQLLRHNADLVTSKEQVPGRFEVLRIEAAEYCDMPEAQAAFDVAFADPPFDQNFAPVAALLAAVIKADGLAVVQFPTRNPPLFAQKAQRLREYGESTLAFFSASELAAV
jgi:16S rRNA (guanine966-N2)-methyltransferase